MDLQVVAAGRWRDERALVKVTKQDHEAKAGASHAEAILGAIRPLVRGIAFTFGRNCEVVLHDFRDISHSIIEIGGDVTHRHIGGSVSEIGLDLLARGEDAKDQINYLTRTKAGRVVKSSTVLIRESDGRVIGALCINLDVTDLRQASLVLEELSGPRQSEPSAVTFLDDLGQVIGAAIDDAAHGAPSWLPPAGRGYRVAVIGALERRGVFSLQRSVPMVADLLGVSRATVYSYLTEYRLSVGGGDRASVQAEVRTHGMLSSANGSPKPFTADTAS